MKALVSLIASLVISGSLLAQNNDATTRARDVAQLVPNPSSSVDSSIAPPAHPITMAQTRQMFALMNFDKMVDQMMQQMIAMQTDQAPYIPTTVWDDFRVTFRKTDFVEVFLPVYQKYISEEDAEKSLEFYQTPAGQHMLKAMPPMMVEVSTLGAQKGQEIARSVLDRHMDEIKAAEKKYEEQKQSAPAPDSQSNSPK